MPNTQVGTRAIAGKIGDWVMYEIRVNAEKKEDEKVRCAKLV